MKINPELQSVLEKHYKEELDELYGHMVITSAYKLSPEEKATIIMKFPFCKGKKIEEVVDPEIIGGIIIKCGSKLVDLSVKTLLQSVQQKLYEA